MEIHVSNKFYQDQNIFQFEQRVKEEKEMKLSMVLSIENFKNNLQTFPSFY
jgi:hypothetical protein